MPGAQRVRWWLRIGVLVTAMLGSPGQTAAQFLSPTRRAATPAEVLGGNVLLGGVTAATRAMLDGRNPFKAFGIGALGGAVHLAGKNLTVEPGAPKDWLGLALAGTGTSMIANAGRGVSPFDELSFPVAAARIRVTPRARDKVRFVLNVYESAVLIDAAFTEGLRIDWERTAASGAAVFITDLRIMLDGKEVGGLTRASVVVVGAANADTSRTVRHEVVHVHQNWFLQDAWGRPIEDLLRRKLPGARFIPRWLELGGAAPGLLALEEWLPGRSGLRAIKEAEAERLERR